MKSSFYDYVHKLCSGAGAGPNEICSLMWKDLINCGKNKCPEMRGLAKQGRRGTVPEPSQAEKSGEGLGRARWVQGEIGRPTQALDVTSRGETRAKPELTKPAPK